MTYKNILDKYKGKIIIVGSRHCPSCFKIKRIIEEKKPKNMVYLEVNDNPDLVELAQKLDIMYVPQPVLISKDGKKACLIDLETKKITKCIEV